MTGVIFLAVRILIAAALYLFIGWLVWVLWQEIKQESLSLAGSQLPSLYLVTQDANGERIREFHTREINIGRDPICDLRLDDQTLSARHAKFVFRQSQWWIEDLHSKNGTFLNMSAVSTPVVVTSGDKIRCGQCEMEIRMSKDD